jgi:hypothetical protein
MRDGSELGSYWIESTNLIARYISGGHTLIFYYYSSFAPHYWIIANNGEELKPIEGVNWPAHAIFLQPV